MNRDNKVISQLFPSTTQYLFGEFTIFIGADRFKFWIIGLTSTSFQYFSI